MESSMDNQQRMKILADHAINAARAAVQDIARNGAEDWQERLHDAVWQTYEQFSEDDRWDIEYFARAIVSLVADL
jgi:hypothetical protein